VQDSPILGDIDALATKHGIDALAQSRLVRELQQERHSLVGNAVLGVVQVQADSFKRQPLPALGIVGEKFPQMKFRNCFVM
jgi:hypothetical protein